MKNLIKNVIAVLVIITLCFANNLLAISSQQTKSSAENKVSKGNDDLEKIFLTPPESAKPGVLWMWMGSNLSKEGITRDLEALKAAGFGRTTMFSLADVTIPWAANIGKSPTPEIISWTEPWWKLVRHAAEESKRLGMDFGIFNGPGYESSGGKWITAEMSMQQLCFSETPVEGGKQISLNVPKPKVDLRAVQPFPVYNPENEKIEKPEIPERGTYYKDIALIAMPDEGIVQKNQIIDLTRKMSNNGKLVCELPTGKWILYRLGYTTMGTLIQPAQWKAVGFECDKMSVEAISFHMDHVIGEIKKHLGDLIGTGITHVHFDSYEAGEPTWTPKFREEFQKRRGYDPLPFLVTMPPPSTKATGFGYEGLSPFDNLPHRIIGSKEETEKFRDDFKATVRDLYNDVYFTTIRNKLHEAKLDFLCEPYGGPWRQEEVMPKIDRVMTEFWTGGGNYTPFEVGPTIAAIRKSGQNLIEAEAFTGMPDDSRWVETPEWLKPIGDAAYCAGINRFVLHRFPQQPWDERYKPGATMGQWGTHFDRTQTWWEPGQALFKYWHRCQAMLLWGKIANKEGDFKNINVSDSVKIQAIHRSDGKSDVFFVANTARIPGAAICSFGVSGKVPEIWDPVTVQMRDLPDYTIKDGQTIIPLKFDVAQSFFIIFRKDINISEVPKTNKRPENFPTLQAVYDISVEWKVQFDPKWGGPKEPVVFSSLEDWTKRTEKGVKYYSGTAKYMKVFDCEKNIINENLYIELGIVKHIAQVKLNGKNLGVVWCAPWKVAIPMGLLKTKGNKIEIEITNVWANRLIGDEQEPADCVWKQAPVPFEKGAYLKEFPDWFLKNEQRPSKGRYCFTTWNYFTKNSPLISSGLIGPVTIESIYDKVK